MGLQHAMKLPYSVFEDQRSGETLSVLTKVRADVEKFMTNFINILFGVLVGVLFVFIYAAIFIHWRVPFAYLVGILLLTYHYQWAEQKNKDHTEKYRRSNNSTCGFYY